MSGFDPQRLQATSGSAASGYPQFGGFGVFRFGGFGVFRFEWWVSEESSLRTSTVPVDAP